MEMNTIHDTWERVTRDGNYSDIRIDDAAAVDGREAKRALFRQHDIPMRERDVAVASGTIYRNADGTIFPVGGGHYHATRYRWELERRPRGFIILVRRGDVTSRSHPIHGIVAHELAHAINWYEHGYTVEGEGIHAEWLDRLDAPY